MCYDREASRLQGPRAVLNFPPGCNPSLTSASVDAHFPVVPADEGNGQDWPATNGSLPAGNADGNAVVVPGPEVSLTSWLVCLTLLRHLCRDTVKFVMHGPVLMGR
jgi:hypothetical protein